MYDRGMRATLAASCLLLGVGCSAGRPPQSSSRATALEPLSSYDEECLTESAGTFMRYRYQASTRTLSIESASDASFTAANLEIRTNAADGTSKRSGTSAAPGSPRRPRGGWTLTSVDDAHGNLVREEYVFERGAPAITTFVNDYGDGKLLRARRVVPALGAPMTETFGYVRGQRGVETVDVGSNGTIEIRYTREHDAAGRLTRVTREGSLHEAANGALHAYWTFAYDAAGRLTRAERFGGGTSDPRDNGTPQVQETWTYDANGVLSSRTRRGDDTTDAPSVHDAPVVTRYGATCAAFERAHPTEVSFTAPQPYFFF